MPSFICVSLGGIDFKECMRILQEVEFAEIRMDKIEMELENVRQIFSFHKNLIATCRDLEEKKRPFLKEAIKAGARYVDLEFDAKEDLKEEIKALSRKEGTKLILSFHDYEKTEEKERLKAIAQRCLKEGADYVKIACFVRSDKDNLELLSLLFEEGLEGKIIVVGMGERGKIARILAPLLGSPFTYASFKEGFEMAEGQISYSLLKGIYRLFEGRYENLWSLRRSCFS